MAIPNKTLIRSNELGEHAYDTLIHFYQTTKYSNIGWLLLILPDKVGKEKKVQEFKFPAQAPHDLKPSTSALKETLFHVATGLRSLKNKPTILFCEWLNYHTS